MKMQKLSHILLISIENPILIYRKGQTTPAVYTSRTKKPDISNGRKQSGMPFPIFARHSSRQSTETVLTHNNIHYKKEHAMNHRNTRLLLSLAVLSALAACGGQESKEQKPASAPTEASAVQTTPDAASAASAASQAAVDSNASPEDQELPNAHKASSNRCQAPKKCRNYARLPKNRSNSAINYGMSRASPKATP